MGTNAMGREAANPGKGTGGLGGRSNSERDREAVASLGGALGAKGLGKSGPHKTSKRTSGKQVVGAGSATTQTYEATPSNLATAIGGSLLSAAMPGVGIAAGPAISQALGYGYEKPTGTTDQFSTDNTNEGSSKAGGTVGTSPIEPKKPKKPVVPQIPLGFTLLEGVGGTLLGT